MTGTESKDPWWKITPQGLILIAVFTALSIVVCVPIARHNQASVAADQAAIDKMVNETNEFAETMRCIREGTWMLSSPEAVHAEIQIALAQEGLAAEWVDPAILRRLEAAKQCP